MLTDEQLHEIQVIRAKGYQIKWIREPDGTRTFEARVPILTQTHRGEYMNAYNQNLKYEVLLHYSTTGELSCQCGEKRPETLTLDHIHNNGGEDRKKNGQSSYGLYLRLRKAGYPEGYQTLCRNCNWMKHIENKRAT